MKPWSVIHTDINGNETRIGGSVYKHKAIKIFADYAKTAKKKGELVLKDPNGHNLLRVLV